MTHSTPKKSVFQKVAPFTTAQCRKKFFKDTITDLYTRDIEYSVKHQVRSLSDTRLFESVSTDVLLEQVCADVLEKKFKQMKRAEEAGYVNAMGYDILDTDSQVYVELKDYSVSMRGGAKAPKLSAMISNLSNKFCTVVALVIDPYLFDSQGYQLYAIPPEAIPSDTSDAVDVTHHKLIKTEKGTMYEQHNDIGGAFSKYKIDSLGDLLLMEDRLKSVNIKKLAKVIRDIEGCAHSSETQEQELVHLKELFTSCVKSGNRFRKAKSKTNKKLPLDYMNDIYTITEKNNQRIMFDGQRLNVIEPVK